MGESSNPMPEVVDAYLQNDSDEAGEAEGNPGAENKKEEEPLSQEPLHVQAAYEFLGRKGITLWADFLITDHHGRLRAARWLAKEVDGVNKILTSNWQPE